MSAPQLDEQQLHLAQLLNRAVRASDAAFMKQSGGGGLSARQFSVLMAVKLHPNLTLTRLIAQTGIDRSRLAEIVRRLVDEGLLRRQRIKADGRTNAMFLTKKGQDRLRQASAGAKRADAFILDLLPVKLRRSLLNGLRSIIDAAGQTPQPPSRPSANGTKIKNSR